MDGLVAFEELDRPLMFFGCGATAERPQVPSLSGFWIFLSRVEPVGARREFSDHGHLPGRALIQLSLHTWIVHR